MIQPYLPLDRIIHAKNGNFIIRESDNGYELWEAEPRSWLVTSENINDFRKDIGKVYKII